MTDLKDKTTQELDHMLTSPDRCLAYEAAKESAEREGKTMPNVIEVTDGFVKAITEAVGFKVAFNITLRAADLTREMMEGRVPTEGTSI